MKQIISAAICLSLAGTILPADASSGSGRAAASGSVLINATPRVVWKAVHMERSVDPDLQYSRVIGHAPNSETIEQKFVSVPILGAVTAVTKTDEIPYQRIDYNLVKSDKFKDLEGSWQLTPVNGGRSTLLQLSSTVDVGVPFSGIFIRSATQKKVNRRIENVKQIAEREQARLAAIGKQDL